MSARSCLDGGGVAGTVARAIDWASTPLGAPDTWSAALRTTVAIVLNSEWPMMVWWGRQRIQIYNDACIALLDHPRAMGQPATSDRRFRTTAVPDEDGVGGLLVTVETDTRARLEAVLAQAPVAIALYRGPTHIFELANQVAQDVIGVRDMIGKPLVEVLPAPVNKPLIAALDHVYRTGEMFMADDFAVTFRRDGATTEHRFKLYLVPMRELDDSISGLFTIGVDITELVMARGEAERANRAKDEFLAILGHELRNPLAPILTALDVMRLRHAEAPRELDVIERQANHLVRLVDDLLDVSRITRGKLELQRHRIELAQSVARAAETAMPLLEQRGHQLTIDVPDHGIAVDADLDRLAQAIANLLTNAAKYTERGGTISVTGRLVGDEVELIVRDNGIGIAAEMLPNVFDMFVQERQTLDRSAGGLGLGLTIVRSLVAMHGGRVAVASEGHGRGSVFTITLPAAAAASADAPVTTARPELPSGAGRSVLVVDDNVDAADLLATSLEMLGFTTRIAHDGAEALQIVESFAPDVAVLDIGLPVMDGFELAGKLREKLQSVRLVALTGYGTETDRRRSREAGFDAHLVKPVALDKLREAVTRA